MRVTGLTVTVLALGAGCSFDAPASSTPDAADVVTDAGPIVTDAKPPDGPAVLPDAAAKVCASAYVTVPAAQTLSKYRRVQVPATWTTAKAACEADGGHLVIPETPTEAVAVYTFLDPLDSSPYYWAGISDPELDGQWTTVTGQPFATVPWGSDDPDQRTGEVVILVGSTGAFYDWYPTGSQEYVCECSP
ncbi:MAG: C-type lectin domain-containing protein [Deltaproteobacteria bacterium]|nr:C-type lectin domain-containing protein [Deltaproteobacteria bacterium]